MAPPFPGKTSIVYKQDGFVPGEAHSFDPDAFDGGIATQGVPLVHYRAIVCPIGIRDKDDVMRREHYDHPGCSNGYLYRKVGTLPGLMTGQSTEPNFADMGMLDGSTVTTTFTRKYLDCDKTVYVAPFDRFFLADDTILWPHWELVTYSSAGRDRLKFPAKEVDFLMDNNGVEYKRCEDFEIDKGDVLWIDGGRRPGADMETSDKRGRTYAVWYLYQPYWYCKRLLHDLRVVQTEDAAGVRKTTRMPFQAMLMRENVFENEQVQDEAGNETARSQPQPASGSLPAR